MTDQIQKDEQDETTGFFSKIGRFLGLFRKESTIRESIEELIDERESEGQTSAIDLQERTLIANVLKLHDRTVEDVMVPRADIVAIDKNASSQELLDIFATHQFSHLPVYEEKLDNIVGKIHIKYLVPYIAAGKDFIPSELIHDVTIVSPAMPVMALLLEMKETKKHMALVVDEFGGIDGLITMNDLIESIVGEIDDEFEPDDQTALIANSDGSITADARYLIEDFEDEYCSLSTAEDNFEDIDTLGGLTATIAGKMPLKGEILKLSCGVEIEVLEADPRRVHKIRLTNVPKNYEQE